MPNRYTTIQIREIRKDYEAGVPIKEITKKYGTSDSSIYRYIEGLERRRTTLTAEDKKKIVTAYYTNNCTAKEVCQQFGIGVRELYDILKSRESGSRRERQRSIHVRLTIDEGKMLLGFTEGVDAFDKMRQRLQTELEKTGEGDEWRISNDR